MLGLNAVTHLVQQTVVRGEIRKNSKAFAIRKAHERITLACDGRAKLVRCASRSPASGTEKLLTPLPLAAANASSTSPGDRPSLPMFVNGWSALSPTNRRPSPPIRHDPQRLPRRAG